MLDLFLSFPISAASYCCSSKLLSGDNKSYEIYTLDLDFVDLNGVPANFSVLIFTST